MLAKLKVYSIALIIAGLAISSIYFYPNFPKKCQYYFQHYAHRIKEISGKIFCNPDLITETAKGEKLFTTEQLNKYDGSPESLGLYVAILGKVYDVQKGAQHYKPGGGYAFFTGKDASKAYVTGDFTDEGLIDDVSGLTDDMIDQLVQWQGFYEKEYVYVGKVIGRYYDDKSEPTENLQQVDKAVERAKEAKQKFEDEKKVFPPCNSQWEHEKGGKVWCSESSGGIERTWNGVPRQFFRPGQTEPSCVCVRTTGSPSFSIEGITDSDRGDLDNPNLKPYDDCLPDADTCVVS